MVIAKKIRDLSHVRIKKLDKLSLVSIKIGIQMENIYISTWNGRMEPTCYTFMKPRANM